MIGLKMVIVAVSLTALWGGTSIAKTFLNNRKEVRAAEASHEIQIVALETMQEMSREETRRTQILAEALSHNIEKR